MIDAALKALRKGELIIYPTDTIYGIGCDMKSPKAIDKLSKLKNRPKQKPFSFICNNISEAARYARISDTAHRVIRRALPGPYTFVLPGGNDVPPKMVSSDRAVGIRIPDHPVPRAIAEKFGSPIVTTSVNVSTEEPICAVGDLAPEFLSAVTVVIDYGPLENEPSTIIDFTEDAPRILRRGKGYEELKPFIKFFPTE